MKAAPCTLRWHGRCSQRPVPDMSSPDLERIHLVKPYGPTTAVDRIDLRIDARAALAWLR